MFIAEGNKYFSTSELSRNQKKVLDLADQAPVFIKREGRVYRLEYQETLQDLRDRVRPAAKVSVASIPSAIQRPIFSAMAGLEIGDI